MSRTFFWSFNQWQSRHPHELKPAKTGLREHEGQNRGGTLKKVAVSRETARPQLHCICGPLCVLNCYGEVDISIFSECDVVYKTKTKLDGKYKNRMWLIVHLISHSARTPAASEDITGCITYSCCLKVCVCASCVSSVSPLLLSGLWSVLASLFSRWETVVGSGVGLVLQLFSCFTGEESAMELWLLLSSSKERKTFRRCACFSLSFSMRFCLKEMRWIKAFRSELLILWVLQVNSFQKPGSKIIRKPLKLWTPQIKVGFSKAHRQKGKKMLSPTDSPLCRC